MREEYTSLGLMSGTSADGVDASIILSNGVDKYEVIIDKFYEYDKEIKLNIHSLKQKIHNKTHIKKLNKDLKDLERKITIFHAKTIEDLLSDNEVNIIGFHGQTIYHNSGEKISYQLGDAKLLSQLSKKDIVYNFRQNDIDNGGEGAPLTPIFHQLIASKLKIELPLCILNIGGISNVTIIKEPIGSLNFTSKDIGPGNCLIDSWVRNNSNLDYDKDGNLALKGTRNEIIFEQAQELFSNRKNQNSISLDVNDFDISFVRGLSLEDGANTLTDFTVSIISSALNSLLSKQETKFKKVLVCGGGRKNGTLMKKINNIVTKVPIKLIDDYNIDGDFVESQAFAFLAIRSQLSLPISFPKTTGCNQPTTGGRIIKY